jgi:High potential iron-sulfur protein
MSPEFTLGTCKEERSMSLSRRAFIENSVIVIATVGVSALTPAHAAPMLSESDPTAVALGYKANASAVDKAKFPQYAAGQSCSGCALFQGAAGAASGPCTIYAGKAVSAAGWCASYAKKP